MSYSVEREGNIPISIRYRPTFRTREIRRYIILPIFFAAIPIVFWIVTGDGRVNLAVILAPFAAWYGYRMTFNELFFNSQGLSITEMGLVKRNLLLLPWTAVEAVIFHILPFRGRHSGFYRYELEVVPTAGETHRIKLGSFPGLDEETFEADLELLAVRFAVPFEERVAEAQGAAVGPSA